MTASHQRNSSLELLRILAQLAIIAFHFETQSFITTVPDDSLPSCLSLFLGSFGRTSVNVFVMLGAWFLIDMPFRSIRFVRLYLTTLFYTVTVTLAILFLHLNTESVQHELAVAFMPFSSAPLWFVSGYLFLLLTMPFLNLFIHSISPRMYRTFYWILLIVLVFMANKPGRFLFGGRFLFHSDVFFMFVIYLIVGYWKKVQEPFFASRTRALLCVLLLVAGCAALCASIYFFSGQNPQLGKELRKTHHFITVQLNSVFCFGLAAALFFFFRSFSFYSDSINRVAKNVLGIYVLHQVPCFFPILWTWFHVERWWNTPYFLLGELGVIASVFTGCWLIDSLREWMMGPIYRAGWMRRFLSKADSFFTEEKVS